MTSSTGPELRFSLVLATVGRTAEVSRLLESLAAQTHRAFELIVVDQNEDDRLGPVLAPFEGRLAVVRIRSERGLSRARNAGLGKATGDVVAFPDDDCRYPPDLLERVADVLAQHEEWDGLTVRVQDERGRPSVVRWDGRGGRIDAENVWRRACSISMFLGRSVVDRVGRFDEEIGAGAGTPYGAGEETDYLLRAIRCGCSLHYEPLIAVEHPSPTRRYDSAAVARGRSYGAGHGLLLRRHPYSLRFKLRMCARPLLGGVLAMLCGRCGKARFHFAVFAGRVRGWLA